jgi:hypothetical protein
MLNTLMAREMRRYYLTLLLLCFAFVYAGCGNDPRMMTYGEFRRLSDEERMKVQKDLEPEEMRDILTVATSKRYQADSLDRMTLEVIIQEGEKVRGKVETIPPTR